jgi:hypothetical protein
MEEYSREEGRGKMEDVGPAQMVGWCENRKRSTPKGVTR